MSWRKLTDTAGSDPVGSVLVNRGRPDPRLVIGSGKADELAQETTALDVDVVVFDNELSRHSNEIWRRSFNATSSIGWR